MASRDSNDRRLPTIAFLCGPSTPIFSQADRVRQWRCCDCATLNYILFPSERKFVSYLARSLPAASLANSPAYKPGKYAKNFSTGGDDGGNKVRELERAMGRMWDVETQEGKWEWEGGKGEEGKHAVAEEEEKRLLVCCAEKCQHVRCKDCFDVDGLGKLIARCGGQKVDEGEYLSWCYLMGK